MSKSLISGSEIIFITKGRIIKVCISFGLFLVFLLYNLFNLQLVNYSYYQEKVYEQITTSSAMKAKRGTIYDSNMNVLATDKTVWRIFVSSRDIKKAEKTDGKDYAEIISRGLAEILSLDYEELHRKISNSSVLDITVKKTASEADYERVIEFIKKE